MEAGRGRTVGLAPAQLRYLVSQVTQTYTCHMRNLAERTAHTSPTRSSRATFPHSYSKPSSIRVDLEWISSGSRVDLESWAQSTVLSFVSVAPRGPEGASVHDIE